MKVSIVTPLFNRAHLIPETADSVRNQSHSDWEWIVVDDGSEDNGADLVADWSQSDSRIQLHRRHREPKGACTCRNIGAAQASGDFIMFLDSDDLLARDCLRDRLEAHTQRANKNESVLYFPTVIFSDSKKRGHLWDDSAHPEEWITSLLTLTPPCQSTGPFWPRTLWTEKAGWNESLQAWQDVELHLRSHFNGVHFEAARESNPDVFHRKSSDSISRVDYHSDEKVESRLRVLRYSIEQLDAAEISPSQRNAAGSMGYALFRTLCQQRKFADAKQLKEDMHSFWPAPLKVSAQETLFCSRQKLDRLPFLKKRWDSAVNRVFPPSPRKLGRTEWTEPTP